MPFRFVHTADIHLDSPLRSLALRDETLANLIGTATRTAFERTVSLCLEERVHALLIAGDLYDGGQTSMKTARFLAAQLSRLDAEGIRTFIARGNHDAESRITAELVLPDSVTVFSGRAEAHTLLGAADGRDVVIHGISFRDPHAPESLLPKFKAAVPDALNIGLLHTSLGGAAGHDPYAPCSLADLEATGFDYWALGHVHARAVHREAAPAIVMPGQPQGRDINEAGPKSVTLASLSGDGGVTLAEHVTAVAQFERVAVDATGVEDWRDLVTAVGEALAAARSAAACDHLVARVRLRGPTPLAWRARVDGALLLAEAQARAERLGGVWVESVDNDTQPAAAPDTGAEADPVSELRALIHREVAPSPSFQAHAREIAETLRGQLPKECTALLGEDEESFNAILSGLIEEGARDVLAHLHGGARRDGEGGA
ncbi:metallophosphoesterase family protein [Rhodospira trueperi]|uniref:DNA repair exonuclease SbcCD nuclease subunit n=1 Tax=Rhodospira trueperi TaxID=69960 RepID=A0A1G6WWR8_9PROT|nr:DNA repair exonuclease [Rhodospira trueperi]SDD70239.1 DNA repair exonuclease SbcCD nuclease subunit [Rhodospira trueperi]